MSAEMSAEPISVGEAVAYQQGRAMAIAECARVVKEMRERMLGMAPAYAAGWKEACESAEATIRALSPAPSVSEEWVRERVEETFGKNNAFRAEDALLSEAGTQEGWRPIETAPKDNQRPLLLAQFNRDTGELMCIDYDGTWESENESWEVPQAYYFWASAEGRIEEPTHWMYQPNWYATMPTAAQEGK